MREIVHLQIGNCGNQMGAKVRIMQPTFKTICRPIVDCYGSLVVLCQDYSYDPYCLLQISPRIQPSNCSLEFKFQLCGYGPKIDSYFYIGLYYDQYYSYAAIIVALFVYTCINKRKYTDAWIMTPAKSEQVSRISLVAIADLLCDGSLYDRNKIGKGLNFYVGSKYEVTTCVDSGTAV